MLDTDGTTTAGACIDTHVQGLVERLVVPNRHAVSAAVSGIAIACQCAGLTKWRVRSCAAGRKIVATVVVAGDARLGALRVFHAKAAELKVLTQAQCLALGLYGGKLRAHARALR